MTPATVIDARELGRRFNMSVDQARRWLREPGGLPHVQHGRRRFTSEEFIAQWMTVNVKNAPRVQGTSPLDSLVLELAAKLVGKLVEQGQLRVVYPVEEKGAA